MPFSFGVFNIICSAATLLLQVCSRERRNLVQVTNVGRFLNVTEPDFFASALIGIAMETIGRSFLECCIA